MNLIESLLYGVLAALVGAFLGMAYFDYVSAQFNEERLVPNLQFDHSGPYDSSGR